MMRITCDRPWLCADLGAVHQVLSWAVHRPGLCRASRILWREVRDSDLTPDLQVGPWLAAQLAARRDEGAVAMLTSRDLRRHHHARVQVEGIEVEALATVGLSNAESIGRRQGPAGPGWGTINMAVRIGAALQPPALIEAMTIAAQARTAAVMALGPMLATGQATGTGTDCIAMAARLDGPPLPYAGLHTALGEALGRACHDAVAQGVRVWMDRPPVPVAAHQARPAPAGPSRSCVARGVSLHVGETQKGSLMAMEAQDIEALIRAAFPKAQITITDLAGDGNHYAAEVIDESFRGMNRVQQQRAVYAALQGKMDGPSGQLHALALTTKAPE